MRITIAALILTCIVAILAAFAFWSAQDLSVRNESMARNLQACKDFYGSTFLYTVEGQTNDPDGIEYCSRLPALSEDQQQYLMEQGYRVSNTLE